MPRPKKQSTVEADRLRVIARYQPDLLSRDELLLLATGSALTYAPKNGRRKRRKKRADAGKKRGVRKVKRTKKRALKKIPKALEREMVKALAKEVKAGRIKPKKRSNELMLAQAGLV